MASEAKLHRMSDSTSRHGLVLLSSASDHSSLVAAVKANNHRDVVDLLAAGVPANPPANENVRTTALHEAVSSGLLSIAKLLLESGADVHRENDFGSAPIHVAAMAGHDCCVTELLDHVEVDLRDREGRTPLQEAVQGGHVDTAALLVARGADLNARDRWERTALGKVYDKLQDRPDVAASMRKLLLSAGAHSVQDGMTLCETPLMLAVAAADSASVARLVEECPESLDTLHFRLGGALHIAAGRGFGEGVDLLLKAGASPSLLTNRGYWGWGQTPLHCAAAQGHSEVVRVLIDAAPNTLDICSSTPALALAARAGSAETVVMLLEAGAGPRERDRNGRTARDEASTAEVREILRRALVQTRPPPKTGPSSTHINIPVLAKVLAAEGGESSRIPGGSPLQAAAEVRSIEVIELLLRAGADVLNADVPEEMGASSVVSMPSPHPGPTEFDPDPYKRKLVRFIEGLGFGMLDFDWDSRDESAALAWINANPRDVNAHYIEGLRPLHMAAAYDMPSAVERLIELGAWLDARTNMDVTPLELAAKRAGYATVERLLWAGAEIEDSLRVACEAGNAPAVRALLEAGANPSARHSQHPRTLP